MVAVALAAFVWFALGSYSKSHYFSGEPLYDNQPASHWVGMLKSDDHYLRRRAAMALDTLSDRFNEATAQEVVPIAPTLFPVDEGFRSEPQKVVFGLYLYGSRVNGMLFRASTQSRIVNVTLGSARLACAFSANEASKAELVTSLREAAGVGV